MMKLFMNGDIVFAQEAHHGHGITEDILCRVSMDSGSEEFHADTVTRIPIAVTIQRNKVRLATPDEEQSAQSLLAEIANH